MGLKSSKDPFSHTTCGKKLTESSLAYAFKLIRPCINSNPTGYPYVTAQVPNLREKTITPHTFRHSVAMNLLISDVDISTIAIWLGHSSIETTDKYMIADMELKRKAMEKVGSAGNISYKYKSSAYIMNFLNSL